MIKISKIHWLSKEAKEAELYLFDGRFNIIAFAHPFNQGVEDIIDFSLHTLNAKEVYSLDGIQTFSVERSEDACEYNILGRVINKELNQIEVGKFVIHLDVSLPNDINTGDYVFFRCDRLDLY